METTELPSPEAESSMSPSIAELLLPPLICLACIGAGLVVWTLFMQFKSRKKKTFHISSDEPEHPDPGHLHHLNISDKHNKVSPRDDSDNDQVIFTLGAKTTTTDGVPRLLSVRPLFRREELHLIQHLQGGAPINVRELVYIFMPLVFSLGFCPLTLLMHGPIVQCLWPSIMFSKTPNINDAIACFLVPAGMVYAISFGFAFQLVSGAFQETQLDVLRHAKELDKLLSLVKQLTCVPAAVRVTMIRTVKDVTMTSVSRVLGQGQPQRNTGKDSVSSKDLDDLLRLLYSSAVREAVCTETGDYWQRSVFKRLEKFITQDDLLSAKHCRTRIHPVQWAFLETLGYFTFLGMLLVKCESYRAELAMCLITVISISLLCYVVADLDSPFHGFFRVNLESLCHVIDDLEHAFNRAAADTVLERSFDLDVKAGADLKSST